jgi:hypothetical protein
MKPTVLKKIAKYVYVVNTESTEEQRIICKTLG